MSVTCSGSATVIVVSGYQNNGEIGATWIFVKYPGTTTWVQTEILIGTGYSGSAPLQGTSVSCDNMCNTLVSGAEGDNTNQGAVWTFTNKIVPTSTPSSSPTITPEPYTYGQVNAGVGSSLDGNMCYLGVSGAIASARSETITASNFNQYSFTTTSAGVWDISYLFYPSSSLAPYIWFSYGTSYYGSASNGYQANSNPTSVAFRADNVAGSDTIFVNWQGYLASGVTISAVTYAPSSCPGNYGQTYMSAALLNPTGTMVQVIASSTAPLITPTPTPTSNPVGAIEWSVPTAYSPTPSPTSLVTWSNSNTRATVPTSGIWAISCWGFMNDPGIYPPLVLTINGGTFNDYDTLGYGATTRTVARDNSGGISAVTWTGYLVSGDYITCSTTATAIYISRSGFTISYIPDLGYHWETVATSAYTLATGVYSVIWSTSNVHANYAGFTSANFDQTYGKITVPYNGVYTVSYSMTTTATSGTAICVGIIMNTFSSIDYENANYASTGIGLIGVNCDASSTGSRSIRVTAPMYTSDYIYAVAVTTSGTITYTKTTLSIVQVTRGVSTHSPSKNPTTSVPTRSPTTSVPTISPSVTSTYTYAQVTTTTGTLTGSNCFQTLGSTLFARSQNVRSGAFGTSTFTVPTSGVWELSYYYYITTAEQMHAWFSYGTGYGKCNDFDNG